MTIPKEEDMPDASICNMTCSCQSVNCLSHSRAQLEKEIVVAAPKGGDSQAQRAVSQHIDRQEKR